MKRFVWMGVIGLTLIIGAVGCGVTSTGSEAAADSPSPPPEPAAEEVTTEATPPETEAGEEAVSAETNDTHGNSCDDPFAGATNIRFTPDYWTSERLAAFAGSDLVDPAGGLATNFCKHSIDYDEILSGGPPPDGIPPIDNPTFDPIAAGDEWLSDSQPVLAVAVGDEAKAYPLAIMTRHEIVNDEIGGIPIAATFCPLCNTGLVFNREVNGEILRFGVSGNLRNSDMVMWDNQTLSWWQQFTGEAIVGELTGTQLEIVPAQLVAWQDFKAAFPAGVVLSTNGRSYGLNPYAGYDSSPRPFLFTDTPDPRLPALGRVLGYETEETAKAYPLETIAEMGLIEDTLEGHAVVIFYAPGQVSALDQSVIADSKEVGSAAVYRPEVADRKLTFSIENGVITDNETGSEWDIFGRAVAGELSGQQLTQLPGRVDFWFAWAAFNPETEIYGE